MDKDIWKLLRDVMVQILKNQRVWLDYQRYNKNIKDTNDILKQLEDSEDE